MEATTSSLNAKIASYLPKGATIQSLGSDNQVLFTFGNATYNGKYNTDDMPIDNWKQTKNGKTIDLVFHTNKDGYKNVFFTKSLLSSSKAILGTMRFFGHHGQIIEEYCGEIKDGKRHGYATLKSVPYGFTHKGEWKDDKANGNGTLTYLYDDSKCEGEWKDDNMDGEGTFTMRGGQVYSIDQAKEHSPS